MNQPAKNRELQSILMSDPCPVVLEHWSTEIREDCLFLHGQVYGHPHMADGTRMRTAAVKWLLGDAGIAQTATLNYILRYRE